jgi:ribosomal protein L7/L12
MQFYEYIQAYDNYFWLWQDDTEVAALPNGSTIAYRDYLVEVIELLADQGLPPFGSLLLALIATNKTMEDGIARVQDFIREKAPEYEGESAQSVITFLRILEQLPHDCKEGRKRIQLLQVLFEDCHRGLGPKASKDIAADIKRFSQNHRGNLLEKLKRTQPFTRAVFQQDFRAIELLHRRFTGTVDILNAMAGLPELDSEQLQIEKKSTESDTSFSKDFVAELLADNKTFQVGALIRRIWSGMNIPFHHTVPSQQPLGGVSDLTNKGDFDKLLISEFANDDLVLLSRLANNEALYLQREIPPSNNDEERILLVDVSIRNWGTPKIIAFAIALAITRHPKTDIACRVFCVGSHCRPALADNIIQLTGSLMEVSEGLHAAAGLEDFFTNYAGKKKSEVFFISTAGAMAYPAVQKVINDYYTWFKYWVNVEQDGSIELYRNQHGSKKFIQHIQLPLEELWTKPPAAAPETEMTEELPALYPLLFPQTGKYKKLLSIRKGCDFLIDGERRLFRFYAKNSRLGSKGLELVLEDLPNGSTDYAVGEDTGGNCLLLCYKRPVKEIIVINLTTKQQYVMQFDAGKSSVSSYNDFFFFENTFCYRNWKGYCTLQHTIPNSNGIKWHDTVPEEVTAAYESLGFSQKRLRAESVEFGSLLKNVSNVYINRAGHLVLGKHQLVINSHVIKWALVKSTLDYSALIKAEAKVPGREFVFPCGSTVAINRSGMAVLTSAATVGFGLYDVLIENAGLNKIQVIHTLKSFAHYSLALCKEKIDNTPSRLNAALSEQQAQIRVNKLTECGAVARVIPATAAQVIYIPLVLDKGLGVATGKEFAGNTLYYADIADEPLTEIPSATFFENNIQSFTRYIKQHEA